MKKILSIMISIILLFSCLGFTTFAKDSSVTISDDYQKLYLNGNSYSRFNTSILDVTYDTTVESPIELSITQQETIKEIFLQTNDYENIIYADIYFKDGATLSVGYLQDDYLNMYNEIITSQNAEYIIDFAWPEGNTVDAEKAALLGKPVTLYSDTLEWCDYYNVTVQSSDGSLTAIKGFLLISDNHYYYVDYEDTDVVDWYDFYPYELSELSAHEITDADLLSDIKEAEEKYYSDDLGFLYDDDLTETISAVFLIFVFAVIPFVIFVVFLILAIRSKTIYRKLFRVICILSASELVIFATIAMFVMMFK